MTKRSIPVCVILSIITCGIYSLYWMVKMTDEANALSGRTADTSGGIVLLLTIVTCGIYGIYWAYKMGEKLDVAKNNCGIASSNSAILYLILELVCSIIGWALMQNDINNVIDASGVQQ